MSEPVGPADAGRRTAPGTPTRRTPSRGAEAAAESRVVLDADEIARACTRMAHQILEANRGAEGLLLAGIPTRGVVLAQRLAATMSDVEGVEVPVGSLDVTMYRDDLRRQPTRAVGLTSLPGGVDDAVVMLVDDVLFSGRTVRAALDALGDLGRPRAVRLAVLVDRGHRQLPIRADHVGKNLPTAAGERVRVRLAETDGINEVTIERDETEPDKIEPDKSDRDEIEPDETERDETERDETERDETERDETERDETEPDETERDGTERGEEP